MSEKNEWKPIDSAPQTGRTLLLGYANSRGNWRTVRGQWMSLEYIEEFCEDPDDVEAGWFETSAEADEGQNCWPINPTHWMPLPSAPGSTSSAPGDAQDERQAFEAWSKRANQGYDLAPNVSGRMATYESNTTEHAYRGFFHGMNAPAAGDARKELTPELIEAGWHQTFSTSNPYCPCNLKSFTKAVRWAECAIAAQQVQQQGEA